MAWTVEIYNPSTGVTTNITNNVFSISSNEKLDNENNTFKVTCKNITDNLKLKQITIKKNGAARFSGLILNQTDSDKGIKITDLDCVDWSYLFNIRIIAKTYLASDSFGGNPELIFKNMISITIPELTFTNVKPTTNIVDSLQFVYISMMEATKKLFDFTYDRHWYVDANKDVHAFNGYENNGVTFQNDGSGYNFARESLSISYVGEQVANKVYIVGSKQSASNYSDEYFTADGVQRYFKLTREPNYSEVYLNTGSGYVLKDSKIESNKDGTEDFLINKKEKYFYIPSNIATPFTGTIKFHYRPTIQIIDNFENTASKNQIGLLIEKVIKNKDITDRLSARQYGQAEIKRKSVEKRIIRLSTMEDVRIGQRCAVIINDGGWNITGNFLVKSVSKTIGATEEYADIEVNSIEMEELI